MNLRPLTMPSLFRCAAGVTFAAVLVSLPTALAAQATPSPAELANTSLAGNYLAARHAGAQRDVKAAAAYYRAALKNDPKNPELLERTFLSEIAGGEFDEASRLAERIIKLDKGHRLSRLVLAVRAIKHKQYAVARQQLAASSHSPIADLTATLLAAWAQYGAGDAREAVKEIDKLTGPDWYAIFKGLHSGMILDLAGQNKDAGKRLADAYKVDATALRLVEAYGSWLSRNESTDAAVNIFKTFDQALPNHPLIVDALDKLQPKSAKPEAAKAIAPGARGPEVKDLQTKLKLAPDGVYGASTTRAVREFQQKNGLPVDGIANAATLAKLAAPAKGPGLPQLVNSPQTGASEVLYELGSLIGRQGGEDLGLIYLQLAIYLTPDRPVVQLAVGDLFDTLKKPELAIKAFEQVPASSTLRRDAEIKLALDLDKVERTTEAQDHLKKLIAARPTDLEAVMALGNIQRAHKDFAACADTYGKGISTVAHPEKQHWLIFYFRGICYERAHDWPKAEADLKKALELFPEQPHVLNYLGYSWIEKGLNLDEGMKMIRRAVEQRPDDGYIVDSLGWAYYRIKNYAEAVKNLERAIELKPEDPTINDHLGDAYWRVGRTLEARFQWAHARDLKPEPEDLKKIEQKLKTGLVEGEPASSAEADKTKKPGGG